MSAPSNTQLVGLLKLVRHTLSHEVTTVLAPGDAAPLPPEGER